ncbi:MAG: hypothetical protein S4CHLAM45_13190 [Chlamydiales bacterium]|nr:hypothetical protein [Chlamydiales bacterium]MCH9619808.1 hypothetical protein [Chlamydiales bacterium]MCH9623414.1 hypothetical protein [Chlamydiales bacterium]
MKVVVYLILGFACIGAWGCKAKAEKKKPTEPYPDQGILIESYGYDD